MSATLITILLAVIGSTGLSSLIQFLISRSDSGNSKYIAIKDELQEIKEQIKKSEKDACRTQMLVLMSDYPEERAELMKLAERYFKDLDGDWYMTDIFCGYLQKNEIEKPKWFKGGE